MVEQERNNPEFDRENIILHNATAIFDSDPELVRRVGPVNLALQQRQIVCITAGNNQGKTTVLKMLGNMLIPDEGFVWYPPNLRTRYITEIPLLLTGTLMYNLTWGNKVKHSDEDIWTLCKLIGLDNNLLNKPDLDVGLNGQRIPQSQRILVCIARALLSPADLLLLSNTLDNMSLQQAQAVMNVLSKMVDDNGLVCLEVDRKVDQSLRKKKTVIIITSDSSIEEMCDNSLLCEGVHAMEQGQKQPDGSMVWYDQNAIREKKTPKKDNGTTVFAKRGSGGAYTVDI